MSKLPAIALRICVRSSFGEVCFSWLDKELWLSLAVCSTFPTCVGLWSRKRSEYDEEEDDDDDDATDNDDDDDDDDKLEDEDDDE